MPWYYHKQIINNRLNKAVLEWWTRSLWLPLEHAIFTELKFNNNRTNKNCFQKKTRISCMCWYILLLILLFLCYPIIYVSSLLSSLPLKQSTKSCHPCIHHKSIHKASVTYSVSRYTYERMYACINYYIQKKQPDTYIMG